MLIWVKRLTEKLEESGWSMAELARRSNVNYDTVNKILRGEVAQPRGNTLENLADALGTTETWLRTGIKPEDGEADEKHSQEYVASQKRSMQPLSGKKARRGSVELLEVPVIGSVQAGAWMEAEQLPEQEWAPVYVPRDILYPGVKRVGFKNVGNSMDKVFPEGTTLVCVLYTDADEEPQPGDYVIVEREDFSGRVEATCKRLMTDGTGQHWLQPESHDPRHQNIPLTGDKHVKEIRIIARVLNYVGKVGGRL